MSLPDGSFPDVLRLHVDRRRLFLGDAKHTERPSDLSSIDRLRHYISWLVVLRRRDIGSVLAVAHPRGLGRAPGRIASTGICRDVRLGGVVEATDVTAVTTVTFVAFATAD